MYSDIGKKIKSWAKIICAAGAVITVLFGIMYIILGPRNMSYNRYGNIDLNAGMSIFKGIMIIILGPVCSWLVSLFVYGFGQMVDDISFLRSKEDPGNKYSELSFGAAFKEGLSSVGGMFGSSGGAKKAHAAKAASLVQVIARAKNIENEDALRDYLESARMEYISSGDYRSASELLVILHAEDIREAVERYN